MRICNANLIQTHVCRYVDSGEAKTNTKNKKQKQAVITNSDKPPLVSGKLTRKIQMRYFSEIKVSGGNLNNSCCVRVLAIWISLVTVVVVQSRKIKDF